MADDPARAVIFGRDAAGYEDARPSYPEAAVAHVESLVTARDVVEVGAGTGKATVAFARDGRRLVCLEPSPQMAELLAEKDLPGVEVVVSTFEQWDGPADALDLIVAAQAWHWVDRERGFSKALRLLRPGGCLALMWNIPMDRYGRHAESYQRWAPQLLAERDERIQRRDDHDWTADMATAGFVDTARFTHHWSQELTAAGYRSLYATYSDHMMLEEPNRTRLLDELAATVDGWGGSALVEYRTEVFSGFKPVGDRR